VTATVAVAAVAAAVVVAAAAVAAEWILSAPTVAVMMVAQAAPADGPHSCQLLANKVQGQQHRQTRSCAVFCCCHLHP
jgi:hypothetical protein